MTSVIIVEDCKQTRNLYKTVLDDNDFNVLSASGAVNEAKSEIISKQPDIVIIDNIMPEKTGRELIEELKKYNLTTKFIMITSVSEKILKKRDAYPDVEAFFQKPVDPEILVNTIKNI